ncbi:hypothetical protein [Crateriforma spongiae]|uniref:hypothetical protein n=1 Tax=Crateriforma spongiae TaxID=2724528 RepID=UPI001446E3B8|nr:hypothetical protein [Crateriforma spongiae]
MATIFIPESQHVTPVPTARHAGRRQRESESYFHNEKSADTYRDPSETTFAMESSDTEARHLLGMFLLMFALMVLPALLLIVYLVMNPDAFMYEIAPQRDLSSWHPGKSL